VRHRPAVATARPRRQVDPGDLDEHQAAEGEELDHDIDKERVQAARS
jgi:hypothetical protein